MLANVVRRHDLASTLVQASVERHAAGWSETMKAIEASPKYGGLRIRPQVGLVPLGADPDSGLFEFAHLGSGPVPSRDAATKRLVLPEDGFAVVLVLVPGGTFHKEHRGAAANTTHWPNPEGPVWP
jgi:hypothetical protein